MSEETPRRLVDMPFHMIIEGVLHFTHPRIGSVVTIHGLYVQGRLSKGDAVIIEGNGKRLETVISGFIHIHYTNVSDRPHDRIDLFVPYAFDGEIEAGMIITRQDES